MADVVHLAQVRDDLKREIYRALAFGIEVVLDMLTGTRGNGEPALLTIDTCIELIIANAIQVRPSLSSSAVERRAMQPILDELKITFAERRAK
jgi:hypothetical protein